MAKKRANGEGNIRKRSDGRWEGRYTCLLYTSTRRRPLKRMLRRLCTCDLKPLWSRLSHAIWDAHLQRISGRSGGYRRKAGLPPKPSEAGSVGRGDAAE